MNVSEALVATHGKPASPINADSVKYADTLIGENENVQAAVIANIRTAREHFPGVVAFTDKRLLIVHKMLNLKRCIAYPYEKISSCSETVAKFQYIATFHVGKFQFTASLNPKDGDAISPYMHRLDSFID
jgi:hypothetical protein